MQQSDRQRFITVLGALAATFGKAIDPALIEGYWMGLGDIEIGAFETAARSAIRKLEFFPKPVELRRLSGASGPEQRAALMWPAVVKASGGVGGGELDEIGQDVFRQMGGRQRLGQMDAQEFQTWGRKEFERLYEMVSEQREVERAQLGAGAEVLQLKAGSR